MHSVERRVTCKIRYNIAISTSQASINVCICISCTTIHPPILMCKLSSQSAYPSDLGDAFRGLGSLTLFRSKDQN